MSSERLADHGQHCEAGSGGFTCTQRELAIIEAGARISGMPPGQDDLAFTHSILCQVGLPRSRVEGGSFLRQSGAAWISVQAGLLDEGHGPVQQMVPYGAMPRLALAWVSTYAKRHGTREVPIGKSASEFLDNLGMTNGGGPRGQYTTLRRQMHALAACRMQLGFKGRNFGGQPVERFDAWISGDGRQRALWPGVMVLSDGFYSELVEHGVPLDNRALLTLKGSALALDVYAWLAHRLHRIEGRAQDLSWRALREQFGQEYIGKEAEKDFKKKFLPALQAALAVYPKARVERIHGGRILGGLRLMASPPPISYRR